MKDFDALAKMAWAQYQRQPGLVEIRVEGNPGFGLRYRFSSSDCAAHFKRLRGLQNSYEPLFANTLKHEGNDVVEIWEQLTGYTEPLRL
jgi:hypothetical protein